jgi:DNA-binding CsgD family transcriptional regulator
MNAPATDYLALKVITEMHTGATVARRRKASWALHLIESSIRSADGPDSAAIAVAECAWSVMCNGAGRHDEACTVAERASRRTDVGQLPWALGELVEACARSGRTRLALDAMRRLEECTRDDDEWAAGLRLRSRALLSDGDVAEALFRRAIGSFARAGLHVQLARTQLVYGEWLRREGRRTDARVRLRSALRRFGEMGLESFRERSRRELDATCAKARVRSVETRDDLTAQEAQIARLAADGHTNPEIGVMLFLSPRTVEYHLHKVFLKLGIVSRRALRAHVATSGLSSWLAADRASQIDNDALPAEHLPNRGVSNQPGAVQHRWAASATATTRP